MTSLPIVQLRSSLSAGRRNWDFTTAGAKLLLRWDGPGTPTKLSSSAGTVRQWDDPLAALQWMASFADVDSKTARWVGFLSYDLGRLFESFAVQASDDLKLPWFAFSLNDPSEESVRRFAPLEDLRKQNVSLDWRTPRVEYLQKVQRVIDYIRAGDVFQVNLSHRISAAVKASPLQIWHKLETDFPAAYGALLDFGDFALVSNSPELFLEVRNDPISKHRIVRTRPIKGTRPRAAGMEEALRDSEKDQAELNMIVDLERNDLGRVCAIGSVKVSQPRTIESHPTIYHGVATIEGILRDDVDFIDLLRATFPGGSITGAPKIRAMQIIEELEPVRRGPYCGAIGYIAADGSMAFNIAIRTIIIKAGVAHVSIGGGIVADSDPAAEYDETLVKAEAMMAALGIELTID